MNHQEKQIGQNNHLTGGEQLPNLEDKCMEELSENDRVGVVGGVFLPKNDLTHRIRLVSPATTSSPNGSSWPRI